MKSVLDKYADLLVNYCLEIKPGDRLLVRTSTLAEPLLRALYKVVLKAGAVMDTQLIFREEKRLLLTEGSEFALNYISPLYEKAFRDYEAFLAIRAPYNLYEDQHIDQDKLKVHQAAYEPISKIFFNSRL